jgi:heterodisulfide reductase subunit C
LIYIDNIVFAAILFTGIYFFVKNIKRLIRNIKLGKDINRSDNSDQRWKNMALIALGQSKMVRRPIAGLLHIIVYIGFLIINIEVLEIVFDGLFGTHRSLSVIGIPYYYLIASFEILAVLVLVSVIVFWLRRMLLRIPRFWNKEMKGFPKNDALYILYFEMILMTLFLVMNATDVGYQSLNIGNPVSKLISPLFGDLGVESLHLIERTAWWLHIVGILIFLNYLYYSKHLHILLAFPNTYFSNLNVKGKFDNLESVTKEVKLMLDPSVDPYANQTGSEEETIEKFGASEVTDLNWVQLMNAYTCTECGRCTSVCPASQTGKELSPRAIMMKTRDRLEEVGEGLNKNVEIIDDGKQLLYDYISPEEIWACTSCNACVEECPVNIDPLSIIIDLRRYLVMEKSAASQELNGMMSNIENNGAPWPYNQMDRLNWKDD